MVHCVDAFVMPLADKHGKHCDHFVCNFQSMQILKKSDLRPYFIFIAPCSIAKLKEMRKQQGVHVTVCIVLFLIMCFHLH